MNLFFFCQIGHNASKWGRPNRHNKKAQIFLPDKFTLDYWGLGIPLRLFYLKLRPYGS